MLKSGTTFQHPYAGSNGQKVHAERASVRFQVNVWLCCAEDDTLISVDRLSMRITTLQKFEVRHTLGNSCVIHCTCMD
jgi:hypothetical protein